MSDDGHIITFFSARDAQRARLGLHNRELCRGNTLKVRKTTSKSDSTDYLNMSDVSETYTFQIMLHSLMRFVFAVHYAHEPLCWTPLVLIRTALGAHAACNNSWSARKEDYF